MNKYKITWNGNPPIYYYPGDIYEIKVNVEGVSEVIIPAFHVTDAEYIWLNLFKRQGFIFDSRNTPAHNFQCVENEDD